MEKIDPWEAQLVKKYQIPSPSNDWDSYICYAEHRNVFDKYKLSRKMNPDLYAGFKIPFAFQSVTRPRFNMEGLGRGVEVNKRMGAGTPRVPFGYFVQRYIKGRHLSIDKRPDGLVIYRGYKINARDFYLWARIEKMPTPDKLKRLKPFWEVPYANVEMIGKHIIEAHLRPSIQTFSKPRFSLVIHGNKRSGWVPEINVIGIHDMILIDDPDDSRRLIVNGDDLRTCYQMANIIMAY